MVFQMARRVAAGVDCGGVDSVEAVTLADDNRWGAALHASRIVETNRCCVVQRDAGSGDPDVLCPRAGRNDDALEKGTGVRSTMPVGSR